MASARKKFDEKNLKFLRELLTLPANKHCFDCNQRGPTYVNVTIGSFVCTTCSGLLRGLTPPHRVKSVTMATFTQEEIDFVSARGNEYCKKVWLGLSNSSNTPSIDSSLGKRDEQAVKDYMVSVYERKRYYVNPYDIDCDSKLQAPRLEKVPSRNHVNTAARVAMNNINNNINGSRNNNTNTLISSSKEPSANSNKSDPFGSLPPSDSPFNSSFAVDDFANFDNNPVFANFPTDEKRHSIVDEQMSALSDLAGIDFNLWETHRQPQPLRISFSSWSPNSVITSTTSSVYFDRSVDLIRKMSTLEKVSLPPSEDRYAALKDLDHLMKSQLASTEPSSSGPSTEWGQPVWTTNFENDSQMSGDNIFESTSNPFSPVTENGWASGANQVCGKNPFKTDVNWTTANAVAQNVLPVSQSLNFINHAKSSWDFNVSPNPFHEKVLKRNPPFHVIKSTNFTLRDTNVQEAFRLNTRHIELVLEKVLFTSSLYGTVCALLTHLLLKFEF